MDALSPPPEPDLTSTISVGDTTVAPGQRVAQVPITLSAPTDHTLMVRWGTSNGVGAYSPPFTPRAAAP